ncbi:DUF1146 family protein [Paenibacillus arenosi]|uniref:DUF1146 domain-containing protein n=1 Tax=Paenibacillus arenosi TaxID=2774142 RepID=A0ABR9AVR5_9BACL|nr:DUF1146 family protein [Paenibacillus arenosi]MBD8498220.1 DUF1146 domain-containing protein [Paenibacillus arenosi]
MEDTLRDVSMAAGMSGIVNMVIALICIALSWWALQHLKLDLFIRQPQGPQGRVIRLLLAIIMGRAVASFFIDYLTWTNALRFLI